MNKIKSILIAGGGTSGYLTVYYLLKNFKNIKIIWIFPQNNNSIGVGEATIPLVQQFLKDLGIDLNDIITELNGSIKLGLKFDGFYKKGHSFYHSFSGNFKESIKNKYLMKYNLIDNDLLKNNENYAVHFDINNLTSILYNKIIKYKNINIIKKEISEGDCTFYKKNITSVYGYKTDLYIDCTGFNRKLINLISNNNFIDIGNKILNNAAFVYRGKYTDKKKQLKNYTTCKAMKYGWVWIIPLRNNLSIGYVFYDKYDINDEFINYIKNIFGKIDEKKIFKIKMQTGRNKIHFINNVFSIGLSSCFIEPLESTGLYFVIKGIKSLGKYLEGKVDISNINNNLNRDYDDVLNFIIAHYKYTNNNNDYWNHYKNLDIKIYNENRVFNNNAWYMILDGMGKKELLKSYLGKKKYLKYYLLNKTFKGILYIYIYIYNKINYNDWLYSIEYKKWKNL